MIFRFFYSINRQFLLLLNFLFEMGLPRFRAYLNAHVVQYEFAAFPHKNARPLAGIQVQVHVTQLEVTLFTAETRLKQKNQVIFHSKKQ